VRERERGERERGREGERVLQPPDLGRPGVRGSSGLDGG
jgi:hypothetical protein